MMSFISFSFTLVGVSGGSWDKGMCPTHCGEWKLLTLFFLGTNNRKFDKSESFFRIFEQTLMFFRSSFLLKGLLRVSDAFPLSQLFLGDMRQDG